MDKVELRPAKSNQLFLDRLAHWYWIALSSRHIRGVECFRSMVSCLSSME